MNTMGTFNADTYNRIRNEVRQYLDEQVQERKSILFYGRGGEGKSYLIQELSDELRDAGYVKFLHDGVPQHTGATTRSQKLRHLVVSSVQPSDKTDPRFIVWDFSM